MNKKILTSGFFAIILLLMPFTSVAGTDEITTRQQTLEVTNTISIDLLIAQIQSLIDDILLYFSDNLNVVNICQGLLLLINSYNSDNPLCVFLFPVWISIFLLICIVWRLVELAIALGNFDTDGYLGLTFLGLLAIWGIINYYCDFIPVTYNTYNLAQGDKSALTNIIEESIQVTGCPCEQ